MLDVRDRPAVEAWIQATVAQYGRLDGAANIAGVIGPSITVANVEDVPYEEFDWIIDVNLKGVFNCMRAELKAMKSLIEEGKKDEVKGGERQLVGSIVNAASVAGIVGTVKNSAYAASKHAVVGLTRAAAKECGGAGVRVNAFAPYVSFSIALFDYIKDRATRFDGNANS